MKLYLTKHQLPSVSIAIRLGDQTVFAEAVGWANVADEVPATAETVYAVGSIAKPMTALAMMKPVESDRIDLEESVRTYVPDFPEKEHDFTVRQLASHTAGIIHANAGRTKKEWLSPSPHLHPSEALDYFQDEDLLFKPGDGFGYSSSGYILLSEVIAKASGMSYTDAMKELVFVPLDMKQTEHDTAGAGNGLEAKYYSAFNEDRVSLTSERRDRSFLFGGGGYISTPSDLVKMGRNLFDDDYLVTATREELFTPVPLNDGSENPQRYALGWRIETSADLKVDDQAVLGIHHGGTVGNAAGSFLLIFPEHDACIAMAMNAIPVDDAGVLRGEMWKILAVYVEHSRD